MLEKEQKRKNKRAQKNQVQVNLQINSFKIQCCLAISLDDPFSNCPSVSERVLHIIDIIDDHRLIMKDITF